MYREEKRRNYELATNEEVQKLRRKQLDLIVAYSNSSISSDEIRGMLKLIANTIDKWVDDYEAELRKKNKEE